MDKCEVCGKKTRSKKDRFCPRHAKAELQRLDALGYFQPMEVVTSSGPLRLSKQRFLTQPTILTGQSETNSCD